MGLCDDGAMGAVCKANPVTGPLDALGNAAGDAAGNALSGWWENVATMAADAHGKMIEIMVAWWVKIPTPTVDQTDGPVARIQEHLAWYMMLAAMIGLVIGATRLALSRAGDHSLRETGQGLLKWVFLTGGGTAAVGLATQAGDAFSSWIIARAAGGDFGTAMAFVNLNVLIQPLGSFLVIILAVIALISALIQAILMFLRGAMLVLLAGTLPLSAAVGVSGGVGKQTLNKHLSWLVAFVLYKPVAAIVYASAFWMVGGGGESDVVTQLSGLFMLVMAVAAMPALMRLITPAVGSLTSSSGGGAGAGAAAGTAAATGARMLSSGGSGGSGGGRGGGGGGQQQGSAQPGLTSPGGATSGGSAAGGAGKAGAGAASAGAGAATGGATAGLAVAQKAGSAAKGAAQKGAQHATGDGDQGGSTPGGATKT